MSAQCPVCRRPIKPIPETGRVRRHNDKAGGMCPMTGHHLPTETREGAA